MRECDDFPQTSASRRRVVLITGGTRGIGLHVARAMMAGALAAPVHCIVCSRSQHNVDACARDMGALHCSADATFECVRCDVACAQDVESMFCSIEAQHGHLDVLVNNAGVMHVGAGTLVNADELRRMLDVNYLGAVHCMQAACRIMSRQARAPGAAQAGLIINMLSSSMFGGRALQGAYAASKAALGAFSDCLQHEVKGDGICIVKVVPRRTLTDMRLANFPNESHDSCLSPDDVASAVVNCIKCFAMERASPHVSGTTIIVS